MDLEAWEVPQAGPALALGPSQQEDAAAAVDDDGCFVSWFRRSRGFGRGDFCLQETDFPFQGLNPVHNDYYTANCGQCQVENEKSFRKIPKFLQHFGVVSALLLVEGYAF